MRIAIGGLAQESQSFSPVPGGWEHFGPHDVLLGDEIVREAAGTRTEPGGALDLARAEGVEIVPTFSARANSSAAPLRQEVFDALLRELLERLRQAGPVDGVLLILHGALVTEEHDDGSGEVLRAVRALIGPDVPLMGTLDLHANCTALMAEQATALAGYHTAPHVDLYETGQRAMSMLIRTIRGEVRPVMALRRLPMLLPGETARTTDGPLSEVLAEALAPHPGLLDVSVFSVQPWLDVADVGCSVLVVADRDRALAEETAARLAERFWSRRREFEVDLSPTAATLREALASDRGPWVLADSADAPSSGAPGDSTAVLAALLPLAPQRDCLLNIVDPPAVARMIEAGVGAEVALQVGGLYAPDFYAPLAVKGYVKLIADGDFVQKGPGLRGAVVHRGRTAVLRLGRIYLVVMERPCRQWDPELYRSLGLEPSDSQVVVVKSPAAFRAAYEPLAAEVRILDAPGPCSPLLRSLPFRRVRRPLFPLDEI